MIKWASLILGIVRLLLALVDYLQRRQKLSEVEAAVLSEMLSDADERLAKIRAAVAVAASGGMPADDDPIFRKEGDS